MIKHIKRFFDDVEVLEDIGADALNVDTDSEHRFVTDKDISSWNKKVDSDGGSTAKNTVVFEEAKKRENITSGESHEKLFGKIQKVITDLHSLAFSGNWKDVVDKPTIPSGAAANYAVVDNDTTNNASFLPTARVVYEHGQEIDQLGRDLTDARTSFRAGCSTVAAAITEMGVPTASNATPEVMATNIKSIKTGTVLLSNVKLDASRSSGSSSSENNISGGASLYLTLSVSDYKTLELGAYTKSSGSDHAGDGGQVSLSCTIDGQGISYPAGGTAVDVSDKSSVTIHIYVSLEQWVAYGKWGQLTISTIKAY